MKQTASDPVIAVIAWKTTCAVPLHGCLVNLLAGTIQRRLAWPSSSTVRMQAWNSTIYTIYIYIYIYIYMVTPPPPLDRPRKYISGLFRRGGGESTTPKFLEFPKIQKIQPRVPLFGNSSGSLKILKPSKFLEFPKFQKIHPKVWIFGNSSGSLKIQKSSKFLEFPKFQNPEKPTPRFGFLELEREPQNPEIEQVPRVSKIPKIQKKTTPRFGQKSKNPKNPSQGSAFWKLEREPQNPKTEQIPRVSKIPKKPTPRFGFLETRAGASFARFLDFEEIHRVSKKIPKTPTQVSDFWKLEREPHIWSLINYIRTPIKVNRSIIKFNRQLKT